jgi:hypothetical protein
MVREQRQRQEVRATVVAIPSRQLIHVDYCAACNGTTVIPALGGGHVGPVIISCHCHRSGPRLVSAGCGEVAIMHIAAAMLALLLLLRAITNV